MIDKWLYTFFGWLDNAGNFIENLIFKKKNENKRKH